MTPTHDRLLNGRWHPCGEREAAAIEAYLAYWRAHEAEWGKVSQVGPMTRKRTTYPPAENNG